MARRVRKQCPACQQLFLGRRDAKTCSERCRKRLQRARLLGGQGGIINFGKVGGYPVGVYDSRYLNPGALAERRNRPGGEAV